VTALELGAHLPLIAFDERSRTVAELAEYARRAQALGYRWLCANDHLLYQRAWLDGPLALAAALEASGDMTIATTVALPVLRGPAQTARMLDALDRLSGGRLVAGLGPGSSAADYRVAGIPFEQRWERFDEAVGALRALLTPGAEPFEGRYYSTRGVELDAGPRRRAAPPLWIASWGSPAGLRRVARSGDGWLASAYNASAAQFAERRAALDRALGPRAAGFPHGLATAWTYVTDDPREAERMLEAVLAPMLRRSVEEVGALGLPVGTPEQCAERLADYAAAGVRRLFVWPLGDELEQLERLRAVAPTAA
jgi:alkanesulfonate monooxygenase SsuD/methylene tetrahydromethanopterin reductase-like flavin-dependent oxidoreductase (luciferase family)